MGSQGLLKPLPRPCNGPRSDPQAPAGPGEVPALALGAGPGPQGPWPCHRGAVSARSVRKPRDPRQAWCGVRPSPERPAPPPALAAGATSWGKAPRSQGGAGVPRGRHGGPPGEPRTLPPEMELPTALCLSRQPPPSQAFDVPDRQGWGRAAFGPFELGLGPVAPRGRTSGIQSTQVWGRQGAPGPGQRAVTLGVSGGTRGEAQLWRSPLSAPTCGTPFLAEERGSCPPSPPPPPRRAILEAPAHPTTGGGRAASERRHHPTCSRWRDGEPGRKPVCSPNGRGSKNTSS